MNFKVAVVALSVLFPFSLALGDSKRFPSVPDSQLTPGVLCTTPSEYRYPEKIPYCKRDVSGEEKWSIINTYDSELGYDIAQMSRSDFKIDHYIPLCMGGANNRENLWPQHKSVYAKTDPFEPMLCDMMAQGRISQENAVLMIKRVKADPDNAQQIMVEIEQF